MDARSDVFGLGAVLAVILTGKPPFTGTSAETTRVKAAQGDVADCLARLDACGADPDLVALCKRCLSPKPADRPANAGEVAKAVSGLRQAADERARQAELDRVKVELQAVERRRRARLRLALASMVGLLLLASGAFLWYSDRQATAERERRGRTADAVIALLDQCAAALKKDDTAQAASLLDATEKRAAEGGAEQQLERLERLRTDLALARELDLVDRLRWTLIDGKLLQGVDVAARLRKVLGRFGVDPDETTLEVIADRVALSVIRDRVVAALDRILQLKRSEQYRSALRRIDPDPYREMIRDVVLTKDEMALAELAGRPEVADQPPGFVAVLGENSSIPDTLRYSMLEATIRKRPNDTLLLLLLDRNYIYHLDRANATDDVGLRWIQAAVATAPANPVVLVTLANRITKRRGYIDLVGAETACREALRLDPKYSYAHHVLGDVLKAKNDFAGAEAAYREVIRLDSEHSSQHYWRLGRFFQYAKNNLTEAEVAYREAVRLDPNYFDAYSALGDVLKAAKNPDGAEAAYREAIRLLQRDRDSNQKFGYLRDLHERLGALFLDMKDLVRAEMAYREALRNESKYPGTHFRLGNLLVAKKDLAGAEVAYRQAIQLYSKYPYAHHWLAYVLAAKKDLVGAEVAYREAIRLDPESAYAHYGLAWLLAAGPDGTRSGKQAVASATRACELTAWKNADYIDTLAAAFAEAGDFTNAVVFQRMAMALPGTGDQFKNESRARIALYERKQPYRDPTLAPCEPAPPPRPAALTSRPAG